MKKIISCIFFAFLFLCNLHAQVAIRYISSSSNEVEESIESIKRALPTESVINLPAFDNDKLYRENDSIHPARFGVAIDVDYSLSDGRWTPCDSGRVWTMTFSSPNAQSLNFIFDEFRLSDGSELYITNHDKSVIYGPVTNNDLTENGNFITDIIPGNKATISIFEPEDAYETSSLVIKKVVHGFKNISTHSENTKSITETGSDIACYPQWEKTAGGVALIISSDGQSAFNGFLLMSTDLSFKPYVLTDLRCLDSDNSWTLSSQEKAGASNLVFKFLSKRTTCGGTTIATSYTYNGSTFRACIQDSLYFALLVEINNSNIKNQSGITWLGWDRSTSTPSSCACILHESPANLLKISFDFSSPTVWYGEWRFEANSSCFISSGTGYPLFNLSKRVIGLNWYSQNAYTSMGLRWCTYFNMFGTLWTGGGTNDTRLSNWLDPIGTNQSTMDSRQYRDFQIVGQFVPCGSEEYSIRDLPTGYGYTVEWSLNDPNSIFTDSLIQNSPSTNECTLLLANGQGICETLKAKIKKSGQVLLTTSKGVCNKRIVYGTYSQTGNNIWPSIPETGFDSSEGFTINPNCNVTIKTSDFSGTQLTFLGVTPTSWSFDSNETLIVKYPLSLSSPIIKAVNPNNCWQFTIPITINGQIPLFNAVLQGQNLVLSTDSQTIRDTSNPVYIEIVNVTTGQSAYKGVANSQSISINTTGWKSGIYLISYYCNNEVSTQKITIK